MSTKFRQIKICKNPNCKQKIEHYKSYKREYCDEACKNRANYLKRTSEDIKLIAMDKAIRKNYKILKLLKKLNIETIEYQTLISHGFDFDAIHSVENYEKDNGKAIQMCHIYDIYFKIKDYKLIFVKN